MMTEDRTASPPFVVADSLGPQRHALRSDLKAVGEWAAILGRSDKTARKFLRQLQRDGLAWRFGASWQVALIAAPAKYLKELGLVAPAISDKGLAALADAIEIGKIGTNLEWEK